MVAGTVQELWRWPVKSMGGEPLRSTRLDEHGVGGDRAHAVLFEHKGERRPLTAREAPRLLAWRASYPFTEGAGLHPGNIPYATVAAPTGRTFRWDDPRLLHALRLDLGRSVDLARYPDGIQDLRRSVLVTTEATRRALEEEMSRPVDVRRFRTNLHLALDAPAWAEHEWQGATLRFERGVALRLLHPCARCAIPTRDPDDQTKWGALLRHLHGQHSKLFGINARVLRSGRVAVGEAVTLER